jgi:hypothetical protein
MTSTIVGIAYGALLLYVASQTPTSPTAPATPAAAAVAEVPASEPVPEETVGAGHRVESDSYTGPKAIARCITFNINRKMPELRVRHHADESPDEGGFLILTSAEPSPTTFGVIRIVRSQTGSRLTTWLPEKSISTLPPEEIARRLVAGC